MKEELPRVYLSGSFSMKPEQEKEWLVVTGCKYKCYSYAFVAEDAFMYSKPMNEMMEMGIEKGVGIMMDSGAYSFHQFTHKKKHTKKSKSRYQLVDDLREKTVKHYVQFIKDNEGRFDFYVNFDYVKDAEKVYAMQKRIERMGIRPMPMFHGDATIDWLERYLEEGYDYIGLGSLKKARSTWRGHQQFYDEVFDLISKYEVRGRQIKTHGFARTSMAMMFNWPWYSVDSSTWARAGGMGLIIIPSNKGIKTFHASNRAVSSGKSTHMLEGVSRKHIEQFVGERGFDLGKLRESKHQRDLFNGYIFSRILEWKKPYLERAGEKTKWASLL